MKKDTNLIIIIVIVVLLIALVIRYFYYRNSNSAIGATGSAGSNACVCPEGTSGNCPDCKPNLTLDEAFVNAIANAKLRVSSSTLLTDDQKAAAIKIIDEEVPKDKDAILVEVNKGGNIITLILVDAEKIYLTKNNGATILLH